jgi:tryptophan 2,3-dioxygenase
LGYKRLAMLQHFTPDTPTYAQLEQRFAQPTLWDAFLHYLAQKGYAVPTELLERDVTQMVTAHEGLQAILIEVYRTDPKPRNCCEYWVELGRRLTGVAVSARQDGGAHHRHKDGNGWLGRVGYLQTTLKPFFPTCGSSAQHFDGTPSQKGNGVVR